MTDSQTNRPSVFIEKIFPVTLLNQQVYYEHGGNPFKGLHRWYSRKPLSFSRASVLASLLPDTVTPEEFEYLLGLERRLGGQPDTKTKLYKTPPSPERIKQVHDLCEKTWGTRTPTVLDAFAGGGSIPFEAVRYGLNVLASDLNPVAVVTMKAAMEYPLKFGPDLQHDIDKWVKWVGDEAEKRLAEFFPSQEGETVQSYIWAHTVLCPQCNFTIPLIPTGWLSYATNYAGKNTPRKIASSWYAVQLAPNISSKTINIEIIKGKKGLGKTIQTTHGDFNPENSATLSRGTGKCPNCGNVIENKSIKRQGEKTGLGHQLYAIVCKQGSGNLGVRAPLDMDIKSFSNAERLLSSKKHNLISNKIIPSAPLQYGHETHERQSLPEYGLKYWTDFFNARQLLALATYAEVISDAKVFIYKDYSPDKAEAIVSFISLILDRCADSNSRFSGWNSSMMKSEIASAQHSYNLMWNYSEVEGSSKLWRRSAELVAEKYSKISDLLNPDLNEKLKISESRSFSLEIHGASADALTYIDDKTVDCVVTDPPYYSTIQYGEMSDFFYVWQKCILADVFPYLFLLEVTDKDREAVANPSRFRNMGESADVLANGDYEAKMALAFAEYFRVLRDDGVMTVQFNHKDSGAWDVLAKSLIDAGFEITASWAVSTENPQNLHQAQKNSVSSTVLLVCRKRDPDADQAWWDDLRPELANLVETRAPEFEANDINGIDLYLSAFGPALNVFSRAWPVLDSAGNEVRPEEALVVHFSKG